MPPASRRDQAGVASNSPPIGAGTCTSSCGWLGSAVQGVGDTDDDGVVDHLVSAPSFAVHTGSGDPCGAEEPNGCNELQGRLYLFSGATGEVLHRLDSPFPAENTFFGFQDVAPLAPGYVTGDGNADVYGALSETGQFQGQGIVFDGASGAFVYSISVPEAQEGMMLWSLDRTDYNRDGTPDLYAGILAVAQVPEDENGGSFVYDGREGSRGDALLGPQQPDGDCLSPSLRSARGCVKGDIATPPRPRLSTLRLGRPGASPAATARTAADPRGLDISAT